MLRRRLPGMEKAARRWAVALFATGMLAMVSGCAAGETAGWPETAEPTSTPTASATPIAWPDGADATTPACQNASSATVGVVNEALRAVSAEEGTLENSVSWLSARPDGELGVWTLTGIVVNEQTGLSTEGGPLVVWATRSNPTSATFDGQVYWMSGAASKLTHFDPLLPAYVGLSASEDAPPAALRCGMESATTP